MPSPTLIVQLLEAVKVATVAEDGIEATSSALAFIA